MTVAEAASPAGSAMSFEPAALLEITRLVWIVSSATKTRRFLSVSATGAAWLMQLPCPCHALRRAACRWGRGAGPGLISINEAAGRAADDAAALAARPGRSLSVRRRLIG